MTERLKRQSEVLRVGLISGASRSLDYLSPDEYERA
jgi:hypothetical protein